MCVRLYNPATGRFLQKDPVYGGSCNAYDYVCGDPVNSTDVSGQCGPACPAIAIISVIFVGIILIMITYYVHKALGNYVHVNGISIPFPSYLARSFFRYFYTQYMVYEIFKIAGHVTWKYGITRAIPLANRPTSQLKACDRWARSRCAFAPVVIVTGWYNARFTEASLMTAYAIRHFRCPPGAPACI
jgi:hypothetical protein